MKRPSINNKIVATIATLALLSGGIGSAQIDEVVELDQLKVAFVFNFSRYITWPEDEKWAAMENFNICVNNARIVDGQFDTLIGQATQNKIIDVIDLSEGDIDIAGTCHIWFIEDDNIQNSTQQLESLRGSGVLTVSDREGFLSYGGILELVLVDNRLRFKVDQELASKERLLISSRLLSLALSKE